MKVINLELRSGVFKSTKSQLKRILKKSLKPAQASNVFTIKTMPYTKLYSFTLPNLEIAKSLANIMGVRIFLRRALKVDGTVYVALGIVSDQVFVDNYMSVLSGVLTTLSDKVLSEELQMEWDELPGLYFKKLREIGKPPVYSSIIKKSLYEYTLLHVNSLLEVYGTHPLIPSPKTVSILRPSIHTYTTTKGEFFNKSRNNVRLVDYVLNP